MIWVNLRLLKDNQARYWSILMLVIWKRGLANKILIFVIFQIRKEFELRGDVIRAE